MIKWILSYDGLDEEDIEEGCGWYVATLGENPKNGNRCFASIGFSPNYADVEVWINGSYGNYTIDKNEGRSVSAMKSYVSKHLSEYLSKLDRWDDNYTDKYESFRSVAVTEKFTKAMNVTEDVLDYCYNNPKYSKLYTELVDKDIWVTYWSDTQEYSLSYNSLKSKEYLSDRGTDDLIEVMSDIYPGSWFADIVE